MLENISTPSSTGRAFSLSKKHLYVPILAGTIGCIAIAAAATSTIALAATPARAVSSPFLYTFNVDGILHEAGSMAESSSPYFWLNSGGKLLIDSNHGSTVIGSLSPSDRWAKLYRRSNPLDTGNGLYPQNIFRLLTRATWGDYSQEVAFKIGETNLTDTPNRAGYSGILLMSRYQDGDNLYYAGIRMDGEAVIKKKYKGTYYTLATKKGVFPGTYNKTSQPNLIPENKWMKLRSEVENTSNGSVSITLSLDRGDGTYEQLLTAIDTNAYGGGTLTNKAYAGIRTDYMDVYFDNYRIDAK